MGKYKTKPIQTDVGIFMHITSYSGIFRHTRHKQTYSGIVQAYSESCITLAYSGLFYIKNPGIFKTRSIFRTRSMLKILSNLYDGALWETAHGYNYFPNIRFLCPLLHKINVIFCNAGLIFTPEVFTQCTESGGQGWGARDHEFWYISSKFYSDITYYFWLLTFFNLSTMS